MLQRCQNSIYTIAGVCEALLILRSFFHADKVSIRSIASVGKKPVLTPLNSYTIK